jgi:cytochrome c5
VKPAGDPAAVANIPGGVESVRKSESNFSRNSGLLASLAGVFGLVILGASANGQARIEAVPRFAAVQNVGQAAGQPSGQSGEQPTPAAPAAPKPVVLPEGDGKPIATEFCQDCHKLTNLTRAHKDLDDWKDTIHTMVDRGARIPDEKIDDLAQYLFTNFGPKPATADAGAGTASASPSVAAAATPAPDSTSAAPATAKAVVELPEGDGKAIATENCQACHKLTNLTKAHKNLDDWKDTVQTMIDRGANVPPDKVDLLVQYLARNFGPKDAAAPAAPPPAPAN